MQRVIRLGVVWVAAVSGMFGACSSADAPRPPLPQVSELDGGGLCTSCGSCVESLPVVSAAHVNGTVDYPDIPPASGPHNGRCWSDWGVLDTEVPAERWVHNLEHGGVVYLYRCEESCESELDTLRELVSTHERTLLTSYAQLPTRFAVIAWGVRLLSDCLDREAFEAFYSTYFNRAPESIATPPAAACARSSEL